MCKNYLNMAILKVICLMVVYITLPNFGLIAEIFKELEWWHRSKQTDGQMDGRTGGHMEWRLYRSAPMAAAGKNSHNLLGDPLDWIFLNAKRTRHEWMNLAECYLKLIKSGESLNKLVCQVWGQSNQGFIQKCTETKKCAPLTDF